MSYLSNAIVGYEHLEPVILGNAALGRSLLLVGPTGSAKTTLAHLLAQSYADETATAQGCAIFNASLPDFAVYPNSLKKTVDAESFCEDSICDKALIVIEEIGQANKENQRIIRDILRRKWLRGAPLPFRMLVATMDCENYDHMVRSGSPLTADFHCVVPLRKPDDIPSCDEIRRIVEVNLFADSAPDLTDTCLLFDRIRACYKDIANTEEQRTAVLTYTSNLLFHLLSPSTAYHSPYKKHVSPRRFIALADQIMIIAAYFHSQDSSENALERSAKLALQYGLAFPLGLDIIPLVILHTKYRSALDGSADPQIQAQDTPVSTADAESLDQSPDLPLVEDDEAYSPQQTPKKKSPLFGLRKV